MQMRALDGSRRRTLLLCLGLAALLAGLSFVAGDGSAPAAAAPATASPTPALPVRAGAGGTAALPDMGFISFRRIAVALVVTLALVVLAIAVLRKTLFRTRLATGGRRILRVLDAVPLGPRRHVFVVSVRDRVLVLGVGPDSIRSLAEMEMEDIEEGGARTASAVEARETGADLAPATGSDTRREPVARFPLEAQA